MKKIILLLSLLCISSIHPNISTPVYAEEIREEQSYLDLSKTTYSIVLDGNGATSGKMTTLLNRVHDKTYALPVNTFKNTGYTFKEWNTSKDGSGQSFQNRSNYTALNSEENQEITLYAIWNPVTYKLSYSMNGGINTLDNPTSYKTGDNLVFSTPEKKGYEFLGWYKERTFKNEVSEVSDFVGNRTLYAKWKPISYPITYQLNQGEFSKKVVNSYTIAQSIILPTPKRNGYKFGGWYTNSECTEKVTSIRKGSCEEKIFYAKWIPCTYKISYVLNGGTNSLNNPGLYTSDDHFVLESPQKSGSTFIGWYLDPSFTKPVSEISNTYGKKTLYAHWKGESIDSICEKSFQSVKGEYSVACLSLKDNQFYSKNNHKQQAASLIKLFIAGTVYENIKNIDPTIQKNLESMITISDNNAANALVKALGNGDASKGMAKVNAYCEKYEYDMTHMGRLLLAPNTKDDNYTSVNDCAHFLEKVYNHSIPGAEKIEQLLLQQKRVSKIPAGIPKGIKVGNKTGELSNVENDAAIVYLEENPYILCVMSEKLSSSDAARKAIVNLSKEICIYMKNPY